MASINKEINKLQVMGVSEDAIAEGMLKSIKELLSQWTLPDDRTEMLGAEDKTSIVDDSYEIGIDMATTAPSFSPATATFKSTPKTKESFFEREYMCEPNPGPKEDDRYTDPKTLKEYIFIKGNWNQIKHEKPTHYPKSYEIRTL